MTTFEGGGTRAIQLPADPSAEDEDEQAPSVDVDGAIAVLRAIRERPSDELQDEWEQFKEAIDAERAEGQKLYP